MRAALALALAAGLLGAGQARPPAVVRVAAAADLKFALDEIAVRLSRRDPPIRVDATYGSSGSMHAQLRQRAPFDVYLSADIGYPRDLVARGIGSSRDLFTYATGRLVVWVPAGSTLPIERDGVRALEGARRIAIANPRHAPYGRAAEAVLRSAGLWAHVRPRLVMAENVAQAAQFGQSGAADAAIIARSLAVNPALRAGRLLDVDPGTHPPVIQGGLILPWTGSRAAAETFRDYLLSAEGRDLLAEYGFGPAGD
ncbi:MAG: molybdate ABC transporter substrate-binding protein [Acidobacteria bacterium RIFCSPLOWO2_12_FULL_67_14]|nr:MAG: molybdate ABC transporter substrate-binding protein [Acidobacteria bacterium RIFCSPLOWO2_02_FULL_67_21]OFW36051.1 MAG: molybdate ABC transporter substrate-binding protein [Acidobacteria bacterium RIFCSPLOWO2_12_FULL_67_14]